MTVISPANMGYLTAYGYSGAVPTAATMIYTAGAILSTTTVNPISPGSGVDFTVFTSQTTHLAIDVLGYFAAPAATALDCINVDSGAVTTSVNAWTAVDANCPVGRTATGGGYDAPSLGTLGYPGVWITTLPNGNGWRTWVDNQTSGTRDVHGYARCCRVPGR